MLAPKKRTDLLEAALEGELVLYDTVNRRAHCLNAVALEVFRLCDGRTAIPAMTKRVGSALKTQIAEPAIWLALEQLSDAGLLEKPVRRPVDLARRRILKKMAVTAGLTVAGPMVWSIVAPTPAYAASVTCVSAMPGGCAGQPPETCCGISGVNALGHCTGAATCAPGNGMLDCTSAVCRF